MSDFSDLRDRIKIDYTENRLKNLTHIDEASPSIEATRLDNACKSAIDIIESDTRKDFDIDDEEHIYYGSELVFAILKRKTGDDESRFYIKDLRQELKEKRKTTTTHSKFKGFSEDTDVNGNLTSRFDFYFE